MLHISHETISKPAGQSKYKLKSTGLGTETRLVDS